VCPVCYHSDPHQQTARSCHQSPEDGAGTCLEACRRSIYGHRAGQGYNGEDHEQWQYQRAIKNAAEHYLRQVLCKCGQLGYIKLWMNMLFVAGFYFAVVLADQGSLTAGNALTTFYAALTAFQALEAVGPHWLVLAKGMAAGQSLAALVNDVSQSLDGESVDSHQKSEGHRPLRCDGDIEMRNVCLPILTFRNYGANNGI
jgi:ABC-type multidrug transport system fused ATPase/permease subunit